MDTDVFTAAITEAHLAGERTLPGLGLTAFWNLGSNGWKDEMDANIRVLSALVQLSVLSRTTTLPGSPTQGDIYIDPDGSPAGQIAIYDNSAWVYIAPNKGTVATVEDEDILVWFDGSAWTELPTGAPTPYDLGGSYIGAPTDGVIILRYPMPRAMTFPASMTGSHGVSGVAATASSVFSLRKNGTQFGTMTFGVGSSIASFAAASQTSFAAGDVLTVMAPSPVDATLADIGFSLAGTRV